MASKSYSLKCLEVKSFGANHDSNYDPILRKVTKTGINYFLSSEQRRVASFETLISDSKLELTAQTKVRRKRKEIPIQSNMAHHKLPDSICIG